MDPNNPTELNPDYIATRLFRANLSHAGYIKFNENEARSDLEKQALHKAYAEQPAEYHAMNIGSLTYNHLRNYVYGLTHSGRKPVFGPSLSQSVSDRIRGMHERLG